MARAFFVDGESVISVKAGAHITSPAAMSGSATVLLGVAEDAIRVTPRFHHFDVRNDMMGDSPVEIMSHVMEAKITMNLIHFDRDVLDVVFTEALGGYDFADETSIRDKAGALLGNNIALLSSGCHFLKMGIESHLAGKPWRFEAAFLDQSPFDFPLGTKRSRVMLNWRAISYVRIGADGTETVQNAVWDYNSL